MQQYSIASYNKLHHDNNSSSNITITSVTVDIVANLDKYGCSHSDCDVDAIEPSTKFGTGAVID